MSGNLCDKTLEQNIEGVLMIFLSFDVSFVMDLGREACTIGI